jgi:uncharacterized membrane protein
MEQTKNFSYNNNVKSEREIKALAEKIARLEKRYMSSKDEESYANQLNDIVDGLTIEDMLRIDIYIQENNLLK